jgi:hypothetical protein
MDDPQDIHDMLIERVHHHVLLHLVSPDHLISRDVLAADVRELRIVWNPPSSTSA